MADIRRRQNSDGSIGYQVRYIDKSNKSGFGYKTFTRSKLAQQFKAEKDLEETGLAAPTAMASDLSVSDSIELWLNICEKIGRDGREPVETMTLIEYQRRAKIMHAYSWNKPVYQLTPTDIVQFRTWLLENYSRDLARRTLSSFSSVLKEMGVQGHMPGNPAIGISIRSSGRSTIHKSDIEIPSDEEIRQILDATQALMSKGPRYHKAWQRYRPMILLQIFTGLRMSELRGLSWDNIGTDHIHIKQRADKLGVLGPVKSRAAYRTIELSSKVRDEVELWRQVCPQSPHDLVFPAASGKPLMRCNFDYDGWQPVMKEAGLEVMRVARGKRKLRPKYTPHALRHYYASKLIALGKDLKFIQSRLGHASAEVTLDVYGHLMKDREEEHRQTADQLASEFL